MSRQLAEVFHSIQGEGAFAGKPMMFVRFAGCSVGQYEHGPEKPATCSAWAGTFQCDTDYRKHFTMTDQQIVDTCRYDTICLTGGEPCDRDLSALIELARHNYRYRIHLETSGTKVPIWISLVDWIVVSPKKGCTSEMLQLCHELRIPIDASWLDDDHLESSLEALVDLACTNRRGPDPIVYLSPVNEYKDLREDSIGAVLRLVDRNPLWRISVQMHKALGVR